MSRDGPASTARRPTQVPAPGPGPVPPRARRFPSRENATAGTPTSPQSANEAVTLRIMQKRFFVSVNNDTQLFHSRLHNEGQIYPPASGLPRETEHTYIARDLLWELAHGTAEAGRARGAGGGSANWRPGHPVGQLPSKGRWAWGPGRVNVSDKKNCFQSFI